MSPSRNNFTSLYRPADLSAQSPIVSRYSFRKPLSAWEHIIAHKLGYEWKNILRLLLQLDRKATNKVDLGTFDTICQQYKVHLSNEELSRIKKHYCDAEVVEGKEQEGEETQEQTAIFSLRYMEFSVALQLHKDSFNLMRNHMLFGANQNGGNR